MVINCATIPKWKFQRSKRRQTAAKIDVMKAVIVWLCDYAEHRQPFDEIKHRHTLNEVGDVAEGRYDWKIERGQGVKYK